MAGAISPYWMNCSWGQPGAVSAGQYFIPGWLDATYGTTAQNTFARVNYPPLPEAATATLTVTGRFVATGSSVGAAVAPGSTDFKLWDNSGAVVDTDTQTVPAGAPGVTFTLSASGWTAGDRWAVSYKPTNGPNNYFGVWLKLEFA